MTNPNMPPDMPSASAPPDDAGLPCVLVFNANDPSGAAGLSADILSVASVGGHALPVSTGAYVRDTTRIFDFFALEEEAVTEQARAILEDAPAQVIKVGFAGSPENVSAIAELAADYAEIPLVTCMPDLSWWEESRIDSYQDAVRELLLPQTTVLVGNHNTLCRWLAPDWHADKPPSARDIARAAAEVGVPYVLITGIGLPEQFLDNVLATPQTVMCSERFERFDANFVGAGDTLAAALAARQNTAQPASKLRPNPHSSAHNGSVPVMPSSASSTRPNACTAAAMRYPPTFAGPAGADVLCWVDVMTGILKTDGVTTMNLPAPRCRFISAASVSGIETQWHKRVI